MSKAAQLAKLLLQLSWYEHLCKYRDRFSVDHFSFLETVLLKNNFVNGWYTVTLSAVFSQKSRWPLYICYIHPQI
jgi:hypothetical protein